MGDAYEIAGEHSDRVLLIGIAPDWPEEGYGWIEPGASYCSTATVSLFVILAALESLLAIGRFSNQRQVTLCVHQNGNSLP
jgi:hypothetical protein